MAEREDFLKRREEAAALIYERGFRYLRPETPEWVEGGNSLAQDEARVVAGLVIEGFLPAYTGDTKGD